MPLPQNNSSNPKRNHPFILVPIGLMLCLNLQQAWAFSVLLVRDFGFLNQWTPETILLLKTLLPFLLLLSIILWLINLGKRKYQAGQFHSVKVLLALILAYALGFIFQFGYTYYIYEILFETKYFPSQMEEFYDYLVSQSFALQAIQHLPLWLLLSIIVLLSVRR